MPEPHPSAPAPASASAGPILLFGGTFDPPHDAHVQLPRQAAQHLGAERIVYIPAAINPLKTDAPPTAEAHRLAMLRLAVRGVPGAEISTVELDRGGPSYFVDTLRMLRHQYGPDADLRFLIGADAAVSFHRWKDWRQILDLAEPAVLRRTPWDAAALRAELAEHYTPDEVDWWMDRVIPVPMMDISATAIRERLASCGPVEDLVPASVAAYIREHHLYGC